MGRKSKAKKLIREALKEEKQKSKKNTKNKKSEKKKKLKKIHFPFKKIIAICSFLLFSLSTAFLLYYTHKTVEVGKYFAHSSTILTLEINSDFENLQTLQGIKSLSKNPFFTFSALKKSISDFFNVNYESDISPLLGKKVGLSVQKNNEQKLFLIYFFESKNPEKTLEKFKINSQVGEIIPLPEHNFPENSIIKKQNFITQIDKFFFLSETEENLQFFLNNYEDSEIDKLNQKQDFQNIKRNLAGPFLAFLYLNNEIITPTDLIIFEDISNLELPKQIILSFLKNYRSEGIRIFEKNGDFIMEAFTNNEIKDLQPSTPFKPELTPFALEDTIAFYSTQNLLNDIKSTEQIIDDKIENIFESIYPKSFDFSNDIATLIDLEALILLGEKKDISILFNISDKNSIEKFEEIIFFLSQNILGFDKEIISSQLPDGTIYQEYIKVPKQLQKETEVFASVPYYFYSHDKNLGNLFFTELNNIFIVSENPDTLTKIIEKIVSSPEQDKTYNSKNLIYLNLEKTFKSEINPFKDLFIESFPKNNGVLSTTILKTK